MCYMPSMDEETAALALHSSPQVDFRMHLRILPFAYPSVKECTKHVVLVSYVCYFNIGKVKNATWSEAETLLQG